MEKQDFIVINNIDAMYQVISYLKKMGHTEIGFLKSRLENKNFAERYLGFQLALASNELSYNSNYVYEVGTIIDDAYQDMKEILKENKVLPTVFVAGNDVLAIGVLRALKEYGLHVPEDISIVGFDDMPVTRMMDPPITSVRIFIESFGESAVERIVHKIEAINRGYVTVQVGCELMIRDSVKNLKV